MLKASLLLAGALAHVLGGGVVRDAVTHAPVAGVLVHVVGTADSVRTDAEGRWSLPSATAGARVRFARPGYTPIELTVAGDGVETELAPVARTLETATISATRGGAEAPVTRTTVERADVEQRYFGQEVPILLATTPSITQYAEGGAYAGYSYMRLRGIDQTRINITLDGVPLNDPEDQVLYFSNFPDFGNSIESVQITRGVGTSSNGTASYAGSVNFESIALAAAKRRGELQVTAGSFDTQRASVEYTTGLTPSGFAAYARVSALATDNYRRHASDTSGSGFLSAGWFGARSSVKLTSFAGRAKTGLSYYAVDEATLRADPRANPLTPEEKDDFNQNFLALTGTHLLGQSGSWSTTAYRIEAGGDYDVRFDSATIGNYGLHHKVFGALTTASVRRGVVALDVGAHANTYARDHFLAIRPELGNRFYTNTGHKQEASAFAKATLTRGVASIHADLQARHARFRYEPDAAAGIGDLRQDWTFVNPKVGATWQVASPLVVYASYGRNGREPTRTDLFAGQDDIDSTNVADVTPLDRVRPEYVNDAELGATWRARGLVVQANLYDMRFHDEIAAIGRLSPLGATLRKNVDRSRRQGLELDVDWTPALAPARAGRLTLGGNAAVSRARIASYVDETGETAVTYHDVEPLLTPRFTSNQRARWTLPALGALPRLTLNVQGRYVGSSFLTNTGDARHKTPASWVADAGATIALAGQELLVQVNNVGNERRAYTGGYAYGGSSYYYVQAPRNLMVTARVHF